MGKNGFTLIELVLATGIFLVTVLGVVAVYHQSLSLSRTSEEYFLALQSAQAKLEEMRGHDFARLLVDYGISGNPGNTFDPTGLTGKGSILFDTTDPSLLGVRIVVSWTEKGRLFGEDANLDGRLDAGEDRNGNNSLDGPVDLVTFLTGGG